MKKKEENKTVAPETQTVKVEEVKDAKTQKSFDFKKEAKKVWGAFVRFMKPYMNLNKTIFRPLMETFFKKHVKNIYLAGCITLLVFALLALRALPNILLLLGNWLILFVVFVVFRLLCEIIEAQTKK